jgi:hypothetical protein
VVFGIPIAKGQAPHPKTIESLENTIPLVLAAGWDEGYTQTTGNPYISGARAEITRKALDAKADVIFYLDYDVAWRPEDLMKVLLAPGDVVAGTYRCKTDDPDEVLYMGALYCDENHRPIARQDGCLKARVVPAGFLRITTAAIDKFMRAYPSLCYGPQYSLSIDLFNHGAHGGLWWGEDYAFSRNYIDCGGEIWLMPDLNLDHWSHWESGRVYKGNFHEYLLAQPGGSKFKESE